MTLRFLTPPSRPPARLLVGIALVINLLAACRPEEGDGDEESDDVPEDSEDGAGYALRALPTGMTRLDALVSTDHGLWATGRDRTYQLVDGALIPWWLPLSWPKTSVVRGPDGAPWSVDLGMRFDGGAWRAEDPGFAVSSTWAATSSEGLAVVVDWNGIDEMHCEEVCSAPWPVHVWTTDGVVTGTTSGWHELAVRSPTDWAGTMYDRVHSVEGVYQSLEADVVGLVPGTSGYVAVTTDGEVWEGVVGSMTPTESLGGEAEASAGDDQDLAVLLSSTVRRRQAGKWTSLDLDTLDLAGQPRDLALHEGVPYAAMDDCLLGGATELSQLACGPGGEVLGATFHQGLAYTAGEEGLVRWERDGSLSRWPTGELRGVVSGPHGVEALGAGGFVAKLVDEEVEVDQLAGLEGQGPFQFGPLVASSGGWTAWGYGEGGQIGWVAFDGEGWQSGLRKNYTAGVVLADDGALWSIGQSGVARQAPGEDRVVIDPNIGLADSMVAVGDSLFATISTTLYRWSPTGEREDLGAVPYGVGLVYDPLTDRLWQGGRVWTGSGWEDEALDLPRVATGFAADGTAFVLDEGLWWAPSNP